MKNILFLIFLLVVFFAKSSFALIEIDITRGNLTPLPVAVSPLHVESKSSEVLKEIKVGSEISKIIETNLLRSGLFNPLEKDSFVQKPDIAHLKPRFEDWKLIKAQALITGKVNITNDKLRVEFRLWDVLAAKEMMALAFTTVPNNWRRVAHIISDKVYQRLTGEEGYFDTRIIYVSEKGPKNRRIKKLAIMDQDGANTKYLTLGNELVLTPRFNPTNQMVTYMSFFRNLPRVYLLDIETGVQEVVGDFAGMTFAPRFSPDGKKIIMSFAKDGNSDIFTMNLETRVVERITEHPAIDTSPSYSPNGKRIVFNSDRGGSPQIYIMSNKGKKIKRISFGKGHYSTPVWSPRGDYIAFTKFYNKTFYIGVMTPEGKGERVIAKGFLVEGPTWTPNGRMIAYTKKDYPKQKKDGKTRIFLIDLTGFHGKEIITPLEASDPSWSPLLD